MVRKSHAQLATDGKFFRMGSERVFLKMVTYGPFGDSCADAAAMGIDHDTELKRIEAAGFNAVRVYTAPSEELLDCALEHGLWIFVGLEWSQHHDFITASSIYAAAVISLVSGLGEWGRHPAVMGVFVGNEIPADMVRWMGAVNVRRALEDLITLGRDQCPELLFGYASFPTTEYLEPENADFTAMNVYLESREDFASYLPRLHQVAGDRPVVISEFGLDTQRNTEELQSEVLLWYVEECLAAGMAGMTIYAWSDRWYNGGRWMDEWSFGLVDENGSAKPALLSLAEVLPSIKTPEHGLRLDDWPMFSVVVCTHNGELNIAACLSSLMRLDYPSYEVIVVNDGSSDNTEEIVSRYPEVRLMNLAHAGLSAARNYGAEHAKGEIIAYTDDDCQPDAGWLRWLAWSFSKGEWHACGGPNLPPRPLDDEGSIDGAVDEAVVASAPGAPSHVLLSDGEAEHIPGCNLVVKKEALMAIGGFDSVYRAAGDDVDFCWRLIDAGYGIGFSGAAFVWHRRRTSLGRYFKQQIGYGKAEALLMKKHPHKFKRGCGAEWNGRVYTGGAMTVDTGSVIYHGAMGTAPYQQLALTIQPLRPLMRGYDTAEARAKLRLAQYLQPLLRRWTRWRYSLGWQSQLEKGARAPKIKSSNATCEVIEESRWWLGEHVSRDCLLGMFQEAGWQVLRDDRQWDLADGEAAGARLLLACEYHRMGTMALVRYEACESSRVERVSSLLEEAGFEQEVRRGVLCH